MSILWPLFAVALSALATGVVRRYALARGILDIPNDRSSHIMPTPRGGGIAIVATFLLGLVWFEFSGRISPRLTIALLGSGFATALAGYLDDRRPIAPAWRLAVHFLAAFWALWWLGDLSRPGLVGASGSSGWIGYILASTCLVWLLNLYNFMDGIDGLAAFEAVTVGFGASMIYLLHRPTEREWVLPALLGLAALGFLVWNWPPAKIFMGDVGSGFLGLTFGVLLIRSGWQDSRLFWSWVILLGAFVVDASITLLRRLLSGERLHEAHCSHAYQHAARYFGAHRPVTVAIGAINVFWLLPLAFAVTRGWLTGIIGTSAAYAPLLCLAIWFKAGQRAARL